MSSDALAFGSLPLFVLGLFIFCFSHGKRGRLMRRVSVFGIVLALLGLVILAVSCDRREKEHSGFSFSQLPLAATLSNRVAAFVLQFW